MEKQGKKVIVCGLQAAGGVVELVPPHCMQNRNFPRKNNIKRNLQNHACVSSSSTTNKRSRRLVFNETDFSNVNFKLNFGHHPPHDDYDNPGPHTRHIRQKPTRSQIVALRTRIDLEYSRSIRPKPTRSQILALRTRIDLEYSRDEEQYEQPEEEQVTKVEVVGPSTPSLKKYKRVSGSQFKSSAVKEVEDASYYTRSIKKRVINKLIGGDESMIQQQDTTVIAEKKAAKAWRSLLNKGTFDSVGREVSFIENVGSILGPRKYKPWKDTVLRSIIAGFLSQRVGDNTSSSAIILLGEVFPADPSCDKIDNVNWNKLMHAKVEDITKAIAIRGMDKKLAKRIKSFLEKTMSEQNNLDLEWLRNAEPEDAKKFILDIHGIGVKTAECVCLLTLRQPAFPVDINVARVTARLGWIPVPPTSDDIQMRVLKENSGIHHEVHRYLWTGLSNLDKDTLYQLHCLMITFGKVFCTNQKPNCISCPMRLDCRYFLSQHCDRPSPPFHETDIEDIGSFQVGTSNVEAPVTPKKRTKARKTPLKIKTRTEHLSYELTDCHPILENFDKRDPDDQLPYLFVPGKTDLERPEDVPGTIMLPYRTALKGSFPLNATHFQENEVFADMKTNETPVYVPRESLEGLPQKILYCGANLKGICAGLTTQDIHRLFHEGYICIRRFDRRTNQTLTLDKRLHKSTSTRK